MKNNNRLTYFEVEHIMPWVCKRLSSCVGKEKSVTSTQLIQECPYKIKGAKLRKIIHNLRLSGRVSYLLATSKGYYITQDVNEAMSWIRSANGRAMEIKKAARAVKQQVVNLHGHING